MRYPRNIKEFKEVWNDPYALEVLAQRVSIYIALAAIIIGASALLTGW